MSTTAVLWSLAAIAAIVVGPTLMQQSENIYQNELSSNGPHQFFSAFRSNELDYYQFYATVSDADASDALVLTKIVQTRKMIAAGILPLILTHPIRQREIRSAVRASSAAPS
ncbi:MAG: hypothetical protein WBN95_04940 [Gammaproteobacteria bacterium]